MNKKDKTFEIPPKPQHYTYKAFGIDSEVEGKDISVCIIGTGIPAHYDIVDIFDIEVFYMEGKEEEAVPEDIQGISTQIAGILVGSNAEGVFGFCPQVKLMEAKCAHKKQSQENSLIASILWAAVKGVDVIVIPFTLTKASAILYQAIDKAYSTGATILVPASGVNGRNILADYDKTVAVSGSMRRKKTGVSIDKKNKDLLIHLSKELPITTTTNCSYVYASKEIASLGIATALVVATLEDIIRTKRKDPQPGEIKKKLIDSVS